MGLSGGVVHIHIFTECPREACSKEMGWHKNGHWDPSKHILTYVNGEWRSMGTLIIACRVQVNQCAPYPLVHRLYNQWYLVASSLALLQQWSQQPMGVRGSQGACCCSEV